MELSGARQPSAELSSSTSEILVIRPILGTQKSGGLERAAPSAYYPAMDNTSRTQLPDGWEPPLPSRDELLRVLVESEAEADAGLFVSGDKVIRELYEAAARLEARLAAPEKPAAATRR